MKIPKKTKQKLKGALRLSVVPLAACSFSPLYADQVVDVLAVSNARLIAAQESQVLVDSLADETVDLIQQYKALNKEIEALRVNNAQVQTKIQDQINEMAEIDKSIVGVAGVSTQIPLLLQKMIDGLENFVELDVPFLIEERRDRIAGIRAGLGKGNQAVGENFRQVLEAYKIENEYGRKIEAYKAGIGAILLDSR